MAGTSVRLEGVIPRRAPRTEDFFIEVNRMLYKTGLEMQKDLQQTVASWLSIPEFLFVPRPQKALVDVYTNSDVWRYLNEGVAPRVIVAKNAPFLVFQRDYQAKTEVKVLGSRTGGKSGPIIEKKSVNWPGIEARKWDEAIAEKYRKRMQARINISMANAARKSHRRG